MGDLTLQSKLTFGRYKGLFIGDVIAFAPETVFWYVANISWFKLGHEAKTALKSAVKIERNNNVARQDAWAMGSFCGNGAWAKADAEKDRKRKSRLECAARERAGQTMDLTSGKWVAAKLKEAGHG